MLNMNHYRNAHHRTLSKAKIEFHDRVKPLALTLPKLGKVKITDDLFTPNKRKVDVANVCSIVDKFFRDVLVNTGRLEDDSCSLLLSVEYRFGGIDVNNPRVDATIISVS